MTTALTQENLEFAREFGANFSGGARLEPGDGDGTHLA